MSKSLNSCTVVLKAFASAFHDVTSVCTKSARGDEPGLVYLDTSAWASGRNARSAKTTLQFLESRIWANSKLIPGYELACFGTIGLYCT